MSVAELLGHASSTLAVTSDSAHADAQILLAHVLQRDRAWLIAHSEEPVSPERMAEFEALAKRRSSGEPIAYILGWAGFYGRVFAVNNAVLIPRPETELLVDEALEFLRARGKEHPHALDIGTGSGAVACTLAAEVATVQVDATDASARALDVAEINADRIGVAQRCRFLHGDLAEPVRGRRYDVIVANLPYVPTADIPPRPDPVSFEPRSALDGGPDGLDLYRRHAPDLMALLAPNAIALLEAGPDNIDALAAIIAHAVPDAHIELQRDYSNLPRYIRVQA